ncbi:MAG: 2-C-methyl-D-erythritol 4-phosphate cytidylyltransferase [Planctomycetota bacterium]
MKVAILLLAAGRGSRFGGEVPKAYVPLDGVPILLRSAQRLARTVDLRNPGNCMVVLVHPTDRPTHLAPLLAGLLALGNVVVADGGATRQESMMRGLAAAGADCELVLVHDAARPLFPVAATQAAMARAAECGAALLAIPAIDTLKRVDAATHRVMGGIDRASTWLAQTPQVLRRDVLERALAQARRDGFEGTDDVSLAEHVGCPVAVVEGSTRNLKITRSDDLLVAAALLASGDAP